MINLVIKLARKEDAVLISLLGRITFTETFGHHFRDNRDLMLYYDRTFSVKKIENSISKGDNIFWIAFADRLPVGYAKLKLHSKSNFIKSESICQLQKIYVLKDFLSKRVGFELQTRLLQKARELRFQYIWLSVLESNRKAINFYKKNNFEQIGKHSFQIGKENFQFIAMGRQLEK